MTFHSMTFKKWLTTMGVIMSAPCSWGALSVDFPALCENLSASTCPGGVALLVSGDLANKDSVQRCSSFLIDAQTLVTNNHCIPDEVKDGTISCKERLFAFFPKTAGLPEEKAECDEVLHLSAEGLGSLREKMEKIEETEEKEGPLPRPDYAVLRLSRPLQRPFFEINRQGLPHGIELTAFTFDPLPGNGLKAVLRKKTCHGIQNTDLVPSYRDAYSPVASFKGCSIIPGNSGSVAVDSRGQVRALVQAMWPLESDYDEAEEKYAPISLMTNMACLPLPKAFAPREDRCDDQRPLRFDFKKLFAEAEKDDFESQFQDFLSTNESPFQFKKKHLFIHDRNVVIPEITCVKKSFLNTELKSSQKEHTLYASLPLWGPTKKITSEYRYKAVPARITLMFTTVQFNLPQLLNEGWTSAHEIRSSFFTSMDQEISLSLCLE